MLNAGPPTQLIFVTATRASARIAVKYSWVLAIIDNSDSYACFLMHSNKCLNAWLRTRGNALLGTTTQAKTFTPLKKR